MKSICITYNPYTLITEITVNGEALKKDSSLKVENCRLQEWVEDMPMTLFKEYRDRNFEVEFTGTKSDFEEVKEALDSCDEIEVSSYKFNERIGVAEAEQTIQAIYADIQQGPAEALKNERITSKFEAAQNQEFAVNVIATMSSGKSTLINALLGKQLMPAANEATTATVVKIIDNDNEGGIFSAVALDSNGNVVEEIENVSLEDMKRLNSNTNITNIELYGDIPFVAATGMKLALLDTPGPNNSRDEKHQEATYKMLEDSDKSLVLFVMNGTQLGIGDETVLLDYVCKQMQNGGKQSRDRFIFAINKMDSYKPKEEGEGVIVRALDGAKKGLDDRGITQPNIFPVTAVAALEMRTDDDEPDVIDQFVRKIKRYPCMHFDTYYDYNHLPMSQRNKIEASKEGADDYGLAEVHSGIISIEQAIKLYIDKYARTNKVKDLVESFNSTLESLSTVAKMQQSIRNDEAKREELIQNVSQIKRNLESAEMAKSHRSKIDALDFGSIVTDRLAEYFRPVFNKINEMMSGETQVEKLKAKRAIEKMRTQCDSILAQVKIDVEQILQSAQKESMMEIVDEYKAHLEQLSLGLDASKLSINPLSLASGTLMDLTKVIEGNTTVVDKGHYTTKTYQKRVEGDVVRKAGNIISEYTPIGWLAKGLFDIEIKDHTYETVTKSVYVKNDVPVVNMQEVSQQFLTPFQKDLRKMRDSVITFADGETERIKAFLIDAIAMIEELIQEKLAELAATEREADMKREEIERKEAELLWLNQIQERVNEIIKF